MILSIVSCVLFLSLGHFVHGGNALALDQDINTGRIIFPPETMATTLIGDLLGVAVLLPLFAFGAAFVGTFRDESATVKGAALILSILCFMVFWGIVRLSF